MELLYPAAGLLNKEQEDFIKTALEGKDVLMVSIHGSHLYGLDREGSDIDIKAVYAPSFKDLVLGLGVSIINKKDDKLNIEIEVKSITSFIRSVQVADTNCIDLLHTPREMLLYHRPLWISLKKYRSCIYSKEMKGIVGYIKKHTAKYTNKINRFKEVEKVLEACSEYEASVLVLNMISKTTPNFKNTLVNVLSINGFITSEFFKPEDYKYTEVVDIVSDHEQRYLEVCGKKYLQTWKLSQLVNALNKEVARYGKRTQEGADKGLDTKSLSHALRVLYQLEDIITSNSINFPLTKRKELLAVKLGQVPIEEVLSEIDRSYERCMSLLSESNLPDKGDITPLLDLTMSYMLNSITTI